MYKQLKDMKEDIKNKDNVVPPPPPPPPLDSQAVSLEQQSKQREKKAREERQQDIAKEIEKVKSQTNDVKKVEKYFQDQMSNWNKVITAFEDNLKIQQNLIKNAESYISNLNEQIKAQEEFRDRQSTMLDLLAGRTDSPAKIARMRYQELSDSLEKQIDALQEQKKTAEFNIKKAQDEISKITLQFKNNHDMDVVQLKQQYRDYASALNKWLAKERKAKDDIHDRGKNSKTEVSKQEKPSELSLEYFDFNYDSEGIYTSDEVLSLCAVLLNLDDLTLPLSEQATKLSKKFADTLKGGGEVILIDFTKKLADSGFIESSKKTLTAREVLTYGLAQGEAHLQIIENRIKDKKERKRLEEEEKRRQQEEERKKRALEGATLETGNNEGLNLKGEGAEMIHNLQERLSTVTEKMEEVEQKRAEEARKRAEAEQKAAEAERKRAEAEQKAAEAERQRAEAERKAEKAEAEKKATQGPPKFKDPADQRRFIKKK